MLHRPALKCHVRALTQRSKSRFMLWAGPLGCPPGAPEGSQPVSHYCVIYFTGRLIISHSPESLSYLQLQNASQFSLSMLGLSALK